MNFNTLIFMSMSFFLNASLIYFWRKNFYKKLGFRDYKAIQRIHLNETPRLGGLIFILSLISYVAYCKSNESIFLLKLILISLTPIIIIGLKEDLFHNVHPVVRLISLIFVGWLFRVEFTGPLPNLINIALLDKLLALQGGISFFYTLCMVTVANGMNLIDGANGLCASVALSILGALLFLCYATNDHTMLATIFTVIIFLIPFLIFNYPYGKIFLGDLGAYSLGLIISMLTIIFFGRHPGLSPWAAVLILIYPSSEVIFSLFRRLVKGRSIFNADMEHLHTKIFTFFRLKQTDNKRANSLVMPSLSGLWLFPLIAITWSYRNALLIYIQIFLFIILYVVAFAAVTRAVYKLNQYKRK